MILVKIIFTIHYTVTMLAGHGKHPAAELMVANQRGHGRAVATQNGHGSTAKLCMVISHHRHQGSFYFYYYWEYQSSNSNTILRSGFILDFFHSYSAYN